MRNGEKKEENVLKYFYVLVKIEFLIDYRLEKLFLKRERKWIYQEKRKKKEER